MTSIHCGINSDENTFKINIANEVTGQKPMTVRTLFEHMEEHTIGSRTSTDD